MKNKSTFFIFLMSSILWISNFTILPSSNEEEPILPAIPFDYSVNPPNYFSTLPIETLLMIHFSPDNYQSKFEKITDEGATLGRVLFYDTQLSALDNISCGSCHIQEYSFADTTQFSMGVTHLTRRNSVPLHDLGWSSEQGFFWDLREVDLHKAITHPLRNSNEIGAQEGELTQRLVDAEYYPALFEDAFGDPEINDERIIEALAQFIKSINTFNSKFDVGATSIPAFQNFTVSELRGLELFNLDCGSCHFHGTGFVSNFGDTLNLNFKSFARNGIQDSLDLGIYERNTIFGKNSYKFTNLKNIALTAPYMHNGSFATLEDVINHYSEEIDPNLSLQFGLIAPIPRYTEVEKEDLLNFMHTLTDSTLIVNKKWSNPFVPKEENIISSTFQIDNQQFTIAPNPVTDFLTIQYDKQATYYIHIFDSSGKTILSRRMLTPSINLNSFKSGIYFIEISNEKGQRSTQKMIKG